MYISEPNAQYLSKQEASPNSTCGATFIPMSNGIKFVIAENSVICYFRLTQFI